MRKGTQARRIWLGVSIGLFIALMIASFAAPEFLPNPNLKMRYLGAMQAPPFGTDDMGIALSQYALQGAAIVTMPAIVAGLVVMSLATVAGLSRCAGVQWTDTVLQAFSELVGALPRMVVVLVVALGIPRQVDFVALIPIEFVAAHPIVEWTFPLLRELHALANSLHPIALAWALLAAPNAMDEAASTAERLGGARFVEALRAHGFSAMRIYVYHIVWLNLRSVIIRQAAEVAMQVVFLEISLSYLAAARNEPSFTHSDATHSWAALLYDGYTALVGGVPMVHALALGLVLVSMVAVMSQAMRLAARPR